MPQTDPWSSLLRPPQSANLSQGLGGRPLDESAMLKLGRVGSSAYDFGVRSAGRSEEALDPSLSFFKALLYGDPEAVNQAIGPARSRVISQYDAARRQVAEFAPRGGGRNEMFAELPFREAGEIGRLTQEARTGAAKELTSIGSLYGQLGLEGLGLSERATGDQVRAALIRREQELARRGKMGESIGRIIALLVGR